MSTTLPPTIAQHFDGRGKDVRATYDRILAIAREWGDVKPEAKKSSIQLLRGTVGFGAVQTRKDFLILTLKAAHEVRSARVQKCEASGKIFQIEVRLTNAKEIDHELQQWMRASYGLARA